MAFRVEFADGSSAEYDDDDDAFSVVDGGVLIVTTFQMRITYSPAQWRRVLEQGKHL